MSYLVNYQPRRISAIWLPLLLLLIAPLHLVWSGSLELKETAPKVEKKKENKEAPVLSFWDGRLVLDIEERMRFEAREHNRTFSSVDDITDGAWLLNRFRVGLAFIPTSWVKLYGQTQDAREAFSERPNIPGVNGAEGTDQWDLRQAYIAFGDLKKFPVQVTVGRQAITYGDGRLVADSKWGNFGRTFDAARFRFEEPHFWVEGFFMRPVQIVRGEFNASDSEDNFGGAYFSTDWVPTQTTDFYVYYRDKKDNQPDLSPTNTIDPQGFWNGPAARFVTIGTRFKSDSTRMEKWGLGAWDYSAEFVYQNGDLWVSDRNSQRLDLSAFATAVLAGYTFKNCLWTPRVGMEYDFASGDHDPNDNNSQSFQNLFPSNHDKYGLMDEFGWRNIHDLRFQVSAKPAKKVDLEFHYHAFWLADTHDFWFRSNGLSTLRTKTPDGRDVRTIGADNFAGQEIDFIVGVEPIPHVKVSTGYSHFFAGPYLADTGPSDDADFFYAMTTFNF
jgi:hypothetical protein